MQRNRGSGTLYSTYFTRKLSAHEHFFARDEIDSGPRFGVFQNYFDNNLACMWRENQRLMDLIEPNTKLNKPGNLEAPLPFRNLSREVPSKGQFFCG